jgi:glycosyltransferase involved in cell wall biosynthesis
MNRGDSSVLIAQPGRQHSHQLARALHSHKFLKRFYTLLPAPESFDRWPFAAKRLLPSAVERNGPLGIPNTMIRCWPFPLAVCKTFSKTSSSGLRLLGEWYAWRSFDRWVAAQLRRELPRVVVGYEMCCAETFEIAKRMGAACVLDAASFDYRLQDTVLSWKKQEAATVIGKALRDRKARELALADRILCVSDIARESYIAAGVLAEKISVNPVGCDTELFRPAAPEKRGPFRFAFVGAANVNKGFDLILDGLAALVRRYPEVVLHVVGDKQAAKALGAGRFPNNVVLHGKASHSVLAEKLAGMDCLVLPSRLDSFGMVVVEALATGVPVIVSENVGAKMAVAHGRNGWIVPAGSGPALAAVMEQCVSDAENVRAMSPACRAAAGAFNWKTYHDRSLVFFQTLLMEKV